MEAAVVCGTLLNPSIVRKTEIWARKSRHLTGEKWQLKGIHLLELWSSGDACWRGR